jgi:hypothetical protein
MARIGRGTDELRPWTNCSIFYEIGQTEGISMCARLREGDMEEREGCGSPSAPESGGDVAEAKDSDEDSLRTGGVSSGGEKRGEGGDRGLFIGGRSLEDGLGF